MSTIEQSDERSTTRADASHDPAGATQIAIITDDTANVELIEEAHARLADPPGKYKGAQKFAHMHITPYSSTTNAHKRVLDDPQTRRTVGLVIMDGVVRRESTPGTTGNSAAAMALIDWLTDTMPEVPVIVLASTRVEGLDLRQDQRAQKNILTLDIAHFDIGTDLARVLHVAVNSETLDEMRVTLRIGEYSARHTKTSGGIEIRGDDYIYRNLQDIHQLLETANGFSPMVGGMPSDDWQTMFRELGNSVYDALIAGTIGKHIARHYQPRNQPRNHQAPVDLRVEIEVSPNETARLYGLPFELAKPSESHDQYLCTCVPMARRIRFVRESKRRDANGQDDGGDTATAVDENEDDEDERDTPERGEPVRPDRPLRLLFINASFKGSALVRRERAPFRMERIDGLNELLNTPDELKAIQTFRTRTPKGASRPPLESVTVVSAKGFKTAQKFEDRIKDLVNSEEFDILHFSGHSVTLKDHGGTFLILPDESGVGVGVSVRLLAEWVSAANINMVLLSSCSGSSLRTSIEIMRTDAEAVLGFRWDVNDHACVGYFRKFYELYLNQNKRVSQAYCGACSESRQSEYGLPVWASAIAVVKN
jgi:hypothetical protein